MSQSTSQGAAGGQAYVTGQNTQTNSCRCFFWEDEVLSEPSDPETDGDLVAAVDVSGGSGGAGGGKVEWAEDDFDKSRPMIAVVLSLSVAIFAVVAMISTYMLMEIMSTRSNVRNTKIRPFLS